MMTQTNVAGDDNGDDEDDKKINGCDDNKDLDDDEDVDDDKGVDDDKNVDVDNDVNNRYKIKGDW